MELDDDNDVFVFLISIFARKAVTRVRHLRTNTYCNGTRILAYVQNVSIFICLYIYIIMVHVYRYL